MKLFISWSGERSQALARALHGWLPLVLHYVEPWLSQSDIDAGDRWGIEIAKELDASAFGITCVTAENVNSPWILFEAGALAKSMNEGRVVPLLLDLEFREISGPLAQFQAKKVEKQGLLDTVSAINRVAQNPEPENRMIKLFDALWSDLEKSISEIPANTLPKKVERPQSEVLEELVASVRAIDSRYRDDWEDSPFRNRRSRHKMIAIEEMIHIAFRDRVDPITLLMAAGPFREDYPWIYDLCFLLYNNILEKDFGRAGRNYEMLRRGIDALKRVPISSDLEFRNISTLVHEIDRVPPRWLISPVDKREKKVARPRAKATKDESLDV